MSCKTLDKYMTTNPHSVGAEQSLKIAMELMDRHKIRHLPVLKDSKVVGILTDRDIKFVSSLQDLDPTKTKVEDVAREEVYLVSPFSKLGDVVSEMATRRLGSAVVMDNGKLVGIFTAVDALSALSELLELRKTGGKSTCCSH